MQCSSSFIECADLTIPPCHSLLFFLPHIRRCHRIGQQARVRCLYFVARGTIDDVLWRLLEKKFSELGEFVEGQEKLRIVVDREYHKIHELHGIFTNAKDDESDNDEPSEGDSEEEDALQLDPDLCNEIEALGEEERRMLAAAEEDDPDAIKGDSKPEASTVAVEANKLGRSEEDAIALLDDDDDDVVAVSDDTPEAVGTSAAAANTTTTASASATAITSEREEQGTVATQASFSPWSILSSLSNFRAYRMYFAGRGLGLEIGIFGGRLVVSHVSDSRISRLGKDSKPRVGDILCSIGTVVFPPVFRSLTEIMPVIRGELERGPTSAVFVEEPTFTAFFLQHNPSTKEAKTNQQTLPKSHPPRDDEIIEID